MRSQEMFTLMQSAREIKVAIDADGDRIGGLLNEQHPLPVEEGESPFDYRRHMRHLSGHVDVAVDRAVVAEDAHSDQEIRSSRLREERNDVAQNGHDKLSSARHSLESLYERGGFELAFLSGATPAAPRRLVEQLGQSSKLLREPVVERRDAKVRGFNVDFDEVADDLDSEEKGLRSALGRVDASMKKEDGTRVVRNKAVDVLGRTLGWVGQTTEGLFRLAGEDELADRIRTSTRRSSGPATTPEETAPDSTAPDSTAPDSTAPDSTAPDSTAPEAEIETSHS